MTLTLGSLFSGYGGLDLAVEAALGATTRWHVEHDDAPARVLAERWQGVPNHRDVTTVDWSAVEPVDVLAGGFPCQDLSLAGRRSGMRPGTRSGLWADFRAAIERIQPTYVVVENVRGLLSGCAESDLGPCEGCVGDGEHRPVLRALGRVLGDLARLGFDAEWAGIRASDVGAPHGRYRVFVLAYRRDAADPRRLLGAGRRAASGETSGWGAPAEPAGRDRAPVTLLPTPKTTDHGSNSPADFERNEPGLRSLPRLLPTPRASEGVHGGPNMRGSSGDLMLSSAAVRMLPTPTAADSESSGGSSPANVTLTDAVTGRRGLELALPGLEASTDGWGPYGAAVRRWEGLTRPAPSPTVPDGRAGAHRLNPAFAEWMMGIPEGWLTDPAIGLSRVQQLRACGNGVVPQQAAAALVGLLERAAA